jgi:formate dehydrogenase subunit delta
MSPDKLAYMANQIGRAFAHQPHEKAVAATAEHIRKFWEPRMRAAILAQLDADQGSRLDPIARDAVKSLRSSVPG